MAPECGCGSVTATRHGDLTADCNDLCPDEPTKTDPGDRGCGVPGPDEANCSEGPGGGFSLTGNANEVETEATSVIATGVQHHIVLVANETDGAFSLYVDGTFESGVAFTSSLTNVNDANGYLGRSLFEADPNFKGSLDEFRIYDVALTGPQIAYSRAQGPDTVIFECPPPPADALTQ